MRRRRPSDPRIVRATKPIIETLEGRQYFITLQGGDEFIFLSPDTRPDGATVHITLTGNIKAEIVGAYPTQFGDVGLTEIPGTLNGTPILGGVGGEGGTRLLGTPGAPNPITGLSEAGIDIVDPGDILGPGPEPLILFNNEGVDNIGFSAIATKTEADGVTSVMYGINVFDQTVGAATIRRALLIRFDDLPQDNRPGSETVVGTIIADLAGSILNPPNGAAAAFSEINGVTAADFDPITGDLFFVVQGTKTVLLPDGTDATADLPQLFSVDVDAVGPTATPSPGAAATIQATVTAYGFDFGYAEQIVRDGDSFDLRTNGPIVNSIVFDQTGAGTARLLASVNIDTVISGGQAAVINTVNRIIAFSPTGGGTVNLGRVTFEGDNLLNVTGIEVGVDDPNAPAEVIYAITAEQRTRDTLLDGGGTGGTGGEGGTDLDASLLEIDLTRPVGGTLPGLVIGSLPDNTDTVSPTRGVDLQGFTFNPNIIDPITGATGAFVGVDFTSDELVRISTTRRFANADVFHIYISEADRDATFNMVVSSIKGNQLVYDTFTDAPPLPLQTSKGVIAFPSNIGRVYIGGRVFVPDPDRWIPFTESDFPADISFGTLPRVTTLTAGITTASDIEIGKILIAGTMTGAVDIDGSIDTYYNGLLLTGDITGDNLATTTRTGNFAINGDINSLIVKSNIGSLLAAIPGNTEQYATGFDAIIQGEVGHFQAVEGSLLGSVVSENLVDGFDDENQREYETHTGTTPALQVSGLNMLAGLLGSAVEDASFLWNDTLDNPQYLNTIGTDDQNGFIRLNGVSDDPTDLADVYAVSLMAGQIITVQNVSGRVNVYDSDRRQIASDAAHFNANAGKSFRFTTDRPGTYYFECIGLGYEVNIRNVGNTTMGGISAGTDIFTVRDAESFRTRVGDIGTLFAGNSIAFGAEAGADFTYDPSNTGAGTFDFSGRDDIRAQAGNIRAVDAASIGLGINLLLGNFNIQTDSGDIGLMRARAGTATVTSAHVNGSLHLFDVFGTASIYLAAVEGLGAIRAGDMAGTVPGYLRVNYDEQGSDGIIGLIDVAGNYGTNSADFPSGSTVDNFNTNGGDPEIPMLGGSPIRTGQGGNVRYMHVGGDVNQDERFNNGASPSKRASGTTFSVGEVRTYTDDGGGTIKITPMGTTTANPAYDPLNPDPAIDPLIGPSLSIITYGVRDHGGVILVDASVEGPNIQGIRIDGGGDAGHSTSVEIGNIAIHGLTGAEGTALTLNADGLPVLPGGGTRRTSSKGPLIIDPLTGLAVRNTTTSNLGTVTTPLTVEIGGSARVDVFSIEGRASSVFAPPDVTSNSGASGGTAAALFNSIDFTGNFTSITNQTGGEMVQIKVGSIAQLSSRGTLGVAGTYQGMTLNPLDIIANDYPFVQQRAGVFATNIGSASSSRGIGNFVLSGAINTINANSDVTDDTTQFEGILGPIVAAGNIGYVQIGEGVAPSGSGTVGLAGIYAEGVIIEVKNQGLGSDIRGDIISLSEVRRISLTNGSIINADIQVPSTFTNGIDAIVGGTFPTIDQGSFNRPFYPIGSINVSGRGGIIGTRIAAGNVGTVNVDDGFGIFASHIYGVGSGQINRISTDGYGLRYMMVAPGASLNTITARGNGELIPTTKFTPSVRLSETQPIDPYFQQSFDPYFGTNPNLLTDIHTVLGTSQSVTTIPGVTDAGVMENVDVRGFRNLGTASAWQMRLRDFNALPETGVEFGMEFAFAAQIGSITTRDRIDGLLVATGKLKTFAPASDVYRLQMNVSGNIGSIHIKGALGNTSAIEADAANSTISKITIDGDLDGLLRASARIGSITVGGQTTGTIQIDNLNGKTNVGTLTAIGGIGPENLVINGDIGKLVIGSGAAFGTVGGTLTVNGKLGSVTVKGGVLDSNIVVLNDLGSVNVSGTLVGDITVSGDVNSITVANNRGVEADSVAGNISIAGNLGTFTVKGGNVAGNVSVGGTWKSFTQTKGNIGRYDVPSGLTVFNNTTISAGEKFSTFKTSGNVFANLSAGTFGNVTINGDLGDGTNPITSTAASWSLLKVLGSIRSGSSTTVSGTLDSLHVGGNVDAGAVVAAGAINKKRIDGVVSGTVTP